ncbi:helix-turn-helix transcriptional regulator [Mesorhizobium sp. WSM3864]|uniref:helix-turn-helix transcriptional regulator n=1 Tax=Mesorhizobium sp. WSM3864 TaxID=2029404 RepID=UPI001FE052FB|nr:helix-turn-helix transcriptional regulator [Mesorhizobium sp. WSM3864]
MDIRKRLGRNLRRLRKAKGLSQEAFADDVGIHRTYISDLERGRRSPQSRSWKSWRFTYPLGPANCWTSSARSRTT